MTNRMHAKTQNPLRKKKHGSAQPVPEGSVKTPGRNQVSAKSSSPQFSPMPAASEEKPESGPEGQPPVKALSIRQPYAGLIMAGIKNVENRSWITYYTGPLVIVATQKPDPASQWDPLREKCKRLEVAFPEDLCQINGAILGIVDFNHIVYTNVEGHPETDHPTLEESQVADWWNPDMVGFILENPRVLPKPIPIKGRLGLYNLAPDILAEIEKQLK